jgi:hypothetical protein
MVPASTAKQGVPRGMDRGQDNIPEVTG